MNDNDLLFIKWGIKYTSALSVLKLQTILKHMLLAIFKVICIVLITDVRLEWQKSCARQLLMVTLIELHACSTKTLNRCLMKYDFLTRKFLKSQHTHTQTK